MKIFFENPIKTIVLLGIFFRLTILYFYQHITLFPDSEGYIELSKLISNWKLSGYEGQRSPGYPLLLSLTNTNLTITVFLQLIIGVINSIVVYKNLLLLKFNSKHSLLITLGIHGFLHVYFYETCILTESLTLFLIMLIFNIVLDHYFETKAFKKELLLSFLIGYLVIIKPFYIFLPFVIYGFTVLKNFNFKKILNQKLIIFTFPLAVFFGWSYVNKINTGYFVPTTFYGINIAQNCVYFAEKAPEKYKDIAAIYVKNREETIKENGDVAMSIWRAHDELLQKTGLSFVDLSFQLNEFSKELIKENPVDYLKQVQISWSDFWKTTIYWNIDAFKIKKSIPVFEMIWHLQHYILKIFKLAFILNLPLLLFAFIRNRKITSAIIISSIVITTSVLQALSTYGTNSRFSYPFEFLMIMVVLMQARMIFTRYKSVKKTLFLNENLN